MRADRLLSIVLLLQSRGRLAGRELARRLEVSERTLHRDMEALSAAGVPVFSVRGAQGGWELDKEWKTQVPGLDDAELGALLMVQPNMTGDSTLAAAVERALLKLTAAMPAKLRAQANLIRERLYVDNTSWNGYTEDLSALPTVQEAVYRDRRLEIDYRKGTEVVARVIDPLGLVAKASVWYLVAKRASGFRTYRLSRITRAKVLDTACDRPRDFQLQAHWIASSAQYLKRVNRYDVVLRVSSANARKIAIWSPIFVVEGQNEFDGKSRLAIKVQFEDEEQAVFVVRGLGPDAEVIEPESLRRRIVSDAAAVLNRTIAM
jgi:predicted DNA-binding transcriptional regulator YafY